MNAKLLEHETLDPAMLAIEPQPLPPPSPMKFAHASGSQPLAGYTIKRGVGIGGFGEVYYAVSDAGKEVALKVIQRNLDVELRGVRQCLNLKHPNLLALYDIKYDDQDRAWVVMEYVTGENLTQFLDRNPNGSPTAAVVDWMQGICAGVAYLHEHGIVHRDLKPGNLFRDEGIVKIGDYGLSKFISCSRRSGQTESVGTFHYMAPEIGKGQYGKEIDVYALGIVLHELVTGRVPFDGESTQEIIMKHLTATPDLTGIAEPFRGAIAKALEKDPAHRFASAQEFWRAISGGAAQLGAQISPAAPSSRADDDGRAEFENLVASALESAPAIGRAAMPVRPASHDEPIAAALSAGWRNISSWWNDANAGTAGKVIILIAVIILIVANAGWLIPITTFLGVCYLIYYAIRAVVVADSSAPHHPPAQEQRPYREAVHQHTGRTDCVSAKKRHWFEFARQELADRSNGQRWTELFGSLLMSAVTVAVITIFMMMMGSKGQAFTFTGWGPTYAWMALASIAAAWSILAVSKIWEGRPSDDWAMRRFGMLVLGLGAGAAVYGLAELLMLQPSYLSPTDSVRASRLSPALYDAAGNPQVLAYMGYFGALFAMLSWWKITDPLRHTRLSIWTVLGYGLAALILHFVLPIPRGFMLFATIAAAVQLASPWVNAKERSGMRRRFQEAFYK